MTQEGKTAAGREPGKRSGASGRSARPTTPSDPSEHARTITEAVTKAWFGAYGGQRTEVPLTVVATLALVRNADPEGPGLEGQILAIAPGSPFLSWLRHIWRMFIELRPDLWPTVYPMVEWLWSKPEPGKEILDGARAVAEAALRSGQLQLTGDDDTVCEVDLLGWLWQELHSQNSRQATGQFFTPAPIADMLAKMTRPTSGSSIHDPAAGTGGLLRSAAQAMRENGDDPASASWVAVDLDRLAAAACAVNMHLWGLGANVLVAQGNSLTDDWYERAVVERQEAIDAARWAGDLREATRALAVLGVAEFPSQSGQAHHAGPDPDQAA